MMYTAEKRQRMMYTVEKRQGRMYTVEKGRGGCIQLKTSRELRKKLKFEEKKILMIGTMNLFSNLVKNTCNSPYCFLIHNIPRNFPNIPRNTVRIIG